MHKSPHGIDDSVTDHVADALVLRREVRLSVLNVTAGSRVLYARIPHIADCPYYGVSGELNTPKIHGKCHSVVWTIDTIVRVEYGE